MAPKLKRPDSYLGFITNPKNGEVKALSVREP